MLVEVERAMSAIIALPRRHRITVAEYHRMGGAGIFGEDDHVELLEGELFDMAPIGSLHANAVARLVHLFFPARDRAVLWVQKESCAAAGVAGDGDRAGGDLAGMTRWQTGANSQP